MSTPPSGRQRAEGQRQAARLLVDLLDIAARAGLPALSWIVGSAGTLLVGRCPGIGADGRAEYTAWTTHLRATVSPELPGAFGRTALHSIAHRYDGLVSVALVADVWDHDTTGALSGGAW